MPTWAELMTMLFSTNNPLLPRSMLIPSPSPLAMTLPRMTESRTWANRKEPLTQMCIRDRSEANLRGANLSEANLRGAYLRGANLSGAKGPFTTFSAGRHTAVFAGGYGVIGCERWSYESWLTDYDEIGRNHDYGDDEIAEYGEFIKLAVARQRRVEAVRAVAEDEGRCV